MGGKKRPVITALTKHRVDCRRRKAGKSYLVSAEYQSEVHEHGGYKPPTIELAKCAGNRTAWC